MQHILCPIDFSDASTHALEQAAAVARWYKARLTAVHVYVPLFMPIPALPVPMDRVPDTERERARLEAVTFVQRTLDGRTDVDVVVDVGQPAAAILARAAALPADLIVLGTHGSSGFERLVLGSVTEKVLRKAACPVLTVPPRSHATSRFPFQRILCAVDFSDWSSAAVELASSLAEQSGAALTLFHVIEWPWREPPPPELSELPAAQAAALAEFRRYLVKTATAGLESLVADAVRERCTVRADVRHGKPYAEILRAAAEDGADLVVLGVHGRNPIDLTVFGSTTNHVVRRATCPVLTLRR
jgi:nucleotide-binding universal stress UspA family protein